MNAVDLQIRALRTIQGKCLRQTLLSFHRYCVAVHVANRIVSPRSFEICGENGDAVANGGVRGWKESLSELMLLKMFFRHYHWKVWCAGRMYCTGRKLCNRLGWKTEWTWTAALNSVVLIQFAFHYGNRFICGALNTKPNVRRTDGHDGWLVNRLWVGGLRWPKY